MREREVRERGERETRVRQLTRETYKKEREARVRRERHTKERER